MKCSKCGGTNVQVQIVTTGAVTRVRKRGILWKLVRFFLILSTAGLWLLVGRSKEKTNTKTQHETKAICQGCGNIWII